MKKVYGIAIAAVALMALFWLSCGRQEPVASQEKGLAKPVADLSAVAGVGKVTGGGTISGAVFGFNVQGMDGGSVSGKLTYLDKRANLIVGSVTIRNFCKGGGNLILARFSGTARLDPFSETATVNGIRLDSFTVEVVDNGEPGRGADTFSITLGSGYSASGVLTGGNIQIH